MLVLMDLENPQLLESVCICVCVWGGGGEGSILHSHFISLVHSTRFLYSVLWEYGMPINSENYTELWELIQALVAKEI